MPQTSKIDPADLMSPQDVCFALRIDKSTLSRWVASGKLVPAMDVGLRLFRRSDVDRLAAERTAS